MQDALWIAAVGGVLVGVLVLGWLVLTWIRRRFLTPPPPSSDADKLWTLDGLRQLKSDGLISDEEFARLRARVLEAFRSGGNPADEPAAERPAGGESSPAEQPRTEPAAPDQPKDESAEPDAGSRHSKQDPPAGDDKPPECSRG